MFTAIQSGTRGRSESRTSVASSGSRGATTHRRRHNDKYIDEISNLAYYGARYYDKILIGWTQSDPLYRFSPDAAWVSPRKALLYTFTENNALRYIDPDGREASIALPLVEAGAALGEGAVSAGLAAVGAALIPATVVIAVFAATGGEGYASNKAMIDRTDGGSVEGLRAEVARAQEAIQTEADFNQAFSKITDGIDSQMSAADAPIPDGHLVDPWGRSADGAEDFAVSHQSIDRPYHEGGGHPERTDHHDTRQKGHRGKRAELEQKRKDAEQRKEDKESDGEPMPPKKRREPE